MFRGPYAACVRLGQQTFMRNYRNMCLCIQTREKNYVCFTIDWSVFGRDWSHLILRGGMGIERVDCV